MTFIVLAITGFVAPVVSAGYDAPTLIVNLDVSARCSHFNGGASCVARTSGCTSFAASNATVKKIETVLASILVALVSSGGSARLH